MSLQPLKPSSFLPPAMPPAPGAAPMLQWLKVADLVVDASYQREINNRRNVRRIAEAFDWSAFAPVIVAPVEGGKFAVIDGQHRSTAAALVGIESVPCMVVIADKARQAMAFAAINGTVTAVKPAHLFYAAVAAGEASAVELARCLSIAGVRILKGGTPGSEQKPGETHACRALEKALKLYGSETLITALQCVTQTGEGNAGLLNEMVIVALCELLATQADWREAGGALLDAMDEFDLESEIDAIMSGARNPNLTRREQLQLKLSRHLTQKLGGGGVGRPLSAPAKPV